MPMLVVVVLQERFRQEQVVLHLLSSRQDEGHLERVVLDVPVVAPAVLGLPPPTPPPPIGPSGSVRHEACHLLIRSTRSPIGAGGMRRMS